MIKGTGVNAAGINMIGYKMVSTYIPGLRCKKFQRFYPCKKSSYLNIQAIFKFFGRSNILLLSIFIEQNNEKVKARLPYAGISRSKRFSSWLKI